MRRTRLGERQVLQMVARAAMVRKLNEDYPDRFWLKGGGLLYHVYKGPRASFVDTDLSEPTTTGTVPDVTKALEIKDQRGFTLLGEDGTWTGNSEILKGRRIPFTVTGYQAQVKDRLITVTVAVREAEVLDPPDGKLHFQAQTLLSEDNEFEVKGLSLEELSAEKVLGWCLKDGLYKHFSDLAQIARDHGHDLDQAKITDLIKEKFRSEREADESAGNYRRLDLVRPADLNKRFATETRLQAIRTSWRGAIDSQIWLLNEERDRGDTVADAENAIELIEGFWVPIIGGL